MNKAQRMRRRRNRIGTSLMFLIVLIALAFIFQHQFIKKLSIDLNVKITNKINYDTLEANRDGVSKHDLTLIKPISPTGFYPTLLDNGSRYSAEHIVGQLSIPNLNISLPIFSTITEENLLYGVVDLKEGQSLGKGNYSIAGQIVPRKDLLLTGLYQIEPDVLIKLTDKESIYVYETYETKVVSIANLEPYQDKLSEYMDSPIISIMIPHPHHSHLRFVALGSLVETLPYSDLEMLRK